MDILPDPRIRQVLSAYSNWPTIPQLFVNGKLIGGCDIVREMDAKGGLKPILDQAAREARPAAPPPPSVDQRASGRPSTTLPGRHPDQSQRSLSGHFMDLEAAASGPPLQVVSEPILDQAVQGAARRRPREIVEISRIRDQAVGVEERSLEVAPGQGHRISGV